MSDAARPRTRRKAQPTREFGTGGGDGARNRPTRLEGDDGSEDQSWTPIALPPLLAEQFVIEGAIDGGGQGNVALAHRKSDPDEKVAIKLYSKTASVSRDDPREAIRAIPAEFAVQFVDPGFGQYRGYWWEVLEYLPEGNVQALTDAQGGKLTRKQVEQLLGPVAEGLEFAHTRSPRITHRDIKPANLLVRSRDPLRVVLADWGLARLTEVSHERHSSSGSAGYASPQAMWGDADPTGDWWGLGMTLAELVLGRHPFELPDGRLDNERAIGQAIWSKPVPLEGLDDERLELLLRGLLTVDTDERWGAAQIRAWLAGESPAVAEHQSRRPDTGRRAGVDTLRFLNQDFDNPADVGTAILQNWQAAGGAIVGRDLTTLELWVAEWAPERSITALADFHRTGKLGTSALLAGIAVRLNPDAEPLFAGERVDLASLAKWAERIAAGDGRLAEVMLDLYSSRVLLDHYRLLPGQSRLGRVQEAWEELSDAAEGWYRRVREAGEFTPQVRAVMLRAAVERAAGEK